MSTNYEPVCVQMDHLRRRDETPRLSILVAVCATPRLHIFVRTYLRTLSRPVRACLPAKEEDMLEQFLPLAHS